MQITSRDSFPELVFQPVKIALGILRAKIIKSFLRSLIKFLIKSFIRSFVRGL